VSRVIRRNLYCCFHTYIFMNIRFVIFSQGCPCEYKKEAKGAGASMRPLPFALFARHCRQISCSGYFSTQRIIFGRHAS